MLNCWIVVEVEQVMVLLRNSRHCYYLRNPLVLELHQRHTWALNHGSNPVLLPSTIVEDLMIEGVDGRKYSNGKCDHEHVTRKKEKNVIQGKSLTLIHTNASWLTSPSGTNMVWTINLCLFRSVWDSMSKGCNMTAIRADCFGSTIPLLGRTQYRLGAVVLTLKQILRSFGLLNFRCDVTTSVNGPNKWKNVQITNRKTLD